MDKLQWKLFASLAFLMLPVLGSSSESPAEFISPTAGKDLELACEDTDGEWKRKSNDSYTDLPKDSDKFDVEDGVLKIKSVEEEDAGYYACFNQDEEKVKEYDVSFVFRVKKIQASFSVDQGSSTLDDIKCIAIGNSDVKIRWFQRPEGSEKTDQNMKEICGEGGMYCQSQVLPMESKAGSGEEKIPAKPFAERVTITTVDNSTKDNTVTSTLTIDDTQFDDRAIYVCRIYLPAHTFDTVEGCENDKYCDEVETLLRVKDPLAAVWPFIGIVAEVVCLCVVIFFCERRRAAEEKEEMEEDGYAANNVGSNSTVRQRK